MRHFARTLSLLGILTLVTLSLTACNKQESSSGSQQTATATSTETAKLSLPDVISFKKMALYPEGLEYDAKTNRFLVTSLHEGTVGTVTPEGQYQVLFQDDHMVSAIGIRLDAKRDRVFVCNSDAGASIYTKKETHGKLAGVAVFQLSTGKLIKYIDLGSLSQGGGHFCNDIALDKATGVAYATDSFSPIIYKIDADYNASIFLNDKTFTGPAFNLNGIVVKDNYLLVDKMNSGQIFKIPLDNPQSFSEVSLPQKLYGSDGMLWAQDGSLIVITNNNLHVGILKSAEPPLNAVFHLTSNDDWKTASIISKASTGDVFATTGVDINGNIYVLYAMLHVLFNPETKQQVETFEIHKVKWPS